jgi:SRSO17 transposase
MAKTYASLRNELDSFLSKHLAGLENAERVEALAWYCQGLGLEIPDKTVFGIATRLAPDSVQAVRQRMQRALQCSRFAHEDIFERLQQTVIEQASDRIAAYCVDDTGFAKKGAHSVGVQRQYSGTLGKIGNCQVAVSLHGVSETFSACLAAQLYLPKEWTKDTTRRKGAAVADDIAFQTKTQIAIEQLRVAKGHGAPNRPVVSDAGYGDSRDFREAITELGWRYAVAVSSTTTVWPPGTAPQQPARAGNPGRPATRDRDPAGKQPVRVSHLAKQLWQQGRFTNRSWRRGSKGLLRGSFCALRVRSAERRTKGMPASSPIWLLLERDESQPTQFKYYLSSLPPSTSLTRLIRIVKLRWRIERDYQDMKQKLGLDRYEGRKWGGFHRHFAMVALMHAFLSLHRESFSPSAPNDPLDLGTILPSFA